MAIDLARSGGRILLAGLKHFAEVPGLVTDHIVLKSLQLYGGAGFTPQSMAAAVALIESGAVRTDVVAGEVFDLDEIDDAMALLTRGAPAVTRCVSASVTHTQVHRELLRTPLRPSQPLLRRHDDGGAVPTALDMSEWADRLGFVAITLSEHHGSDDGYLPSPIAMAAAIAGRTPARISIAALVAPSTTRSGSPKTSPSSTSSATAVSTSSSPTATSGGSSPCSTWRLATGPAPPRRWSRRSARRGRASRSSTGDAPCRSRRRRASPVARRSPSAA